MVSKMHICYIYVFDYLVLKNIGLTFDDRFVFGTEEGILKIARNENALPKAFWGQGIYSLSAIVGENGSGKTTALRLMKKLIVDGEAREEGVKVVIVYEQKGELYVYNPQNLRVDCERGIKCYNLRRRRTIETFYYSGHFQPYTGAEGEMELSGSYDASDSWLLIKDLLDYSRVDTYHLTEPIFNHLGAYYAQNNYRICETLLLDGLDGLLNNFRLPRYVVLAPNRSGWNAIRLDRAGWYKKMGIPNEKFSSRNKRYRALERFIYYDIINLIAEGKGHPGSLVEYLHLWLSRPKKGNVVLAFRDFIENDIILEEDKRTLASVAYVISEMNELCSFDADSGSFYIDILNEKDQLRTLVEDVLRSHFFLTARFFDIYYGHGLTGNQRLSSGELEMLNLLSRLYYGIMLLPQKFGNKKPPQLLLLDEAEIGFHPDWQRQYVRILTDFMGYMMVKANVDFQIVITSHSPIILSDIPVCCINFLRRKGDATWLVKDEKQTFGENVFNLYRRAFFMENGLVGDFARKKLKSIQKAIDEKRVTKEILQLIYMIGDDRIKEYFLKHLSYKDIDGEIKYHEAKIRELKMRKEGRDE